MEVNEKFMERALELARKGEPFASPNPMVGAVIVTPEGLIIGEGYHRKCGEPHAEVNAINSVADKSLLKDSTMYVTLEPCAHYGRTGPCAELIIKMGIPRVVVGTRDPFEKVDGKGIEMLIDAGVEVVVGCLERQCVNLNVKFFTAHRLHRPFIALKWAETADGFIGNMGNGSEPVKISTPVTSMLMHRFRSTFDAIMVGSGTVLSDNPQLTVRQWTGNSPMRVIVDRRCRLPQDCKVLSDGAAPTIVIRDNESLAQIMLDLYEREKIISILVEGGAQLLNSFIAEGLWDMARVEVGTFKLGKGDNVPAPRLSGQELERIFNIEGQSIRYYSHNCLFDVKNL